MTSAYVVIKWPACYNNCSVDRGARNFDDRISEVPLYRRCVLWIKVGSVECGKLVDWAACVVPPLTIPALLPHGQPCLLIVRVHS